MSAIDGRHWRAPIFVEAKVDQAMTGVRSLAKKPWVLSVEEHFAGYFDELGISIYVTGDASVDDVSRLKDEVAAFLNGLLPRDVGPFMWLLMFKRHGETLEVVDGGLSRPIAKTP